MKLRPYQEKLIEEVNGHFKAGENEVVLAACPGAGKTMMALRMAVDEPGRVLVLAHGTTNLRTQWKERAGGLGIDLEKENIQIGIPQELHRNDLDKVNLLIVDEAHEFYLAKSKKKDSVGNMIHRIKGKTNPKRILLLTGTPSKFIADKKKRPLCMIAANELVEAQEILKDKYIDSVYFGFATTNQRFLDNDHNNEGDLLKGVEFQYTEDDVEALVNEIYKRCRDTILLPTKSNKTVHKIISKADFLLKRLEKTLWVCHDVTQARKVKKVLSKKTKCVLSTHKDDIGAELVEAFQNDPEIRVLIVVRRANLGFDMPDLVNVVDMSGTKNIDRMYQMFARVMRVHPKSKSKYYFKLVPQELDEVYKHYSMAALGLTRREILSRYNGKNLKSVIPVIVRDRGKNNNKTHNKKGQKKQTQYLPVCDDMKNELMSFFEYNRLWNELTNKKDQPYNERAMVNLGKVMEADYGDTRRIVQVTRENLEFMRDTHQLDERIYEENPQQIDLQHSVQTHDQPMTRIEFYYKFNTIYDYIHRNDPLLLDEVFPSSRKSPEERIKQIEAFVKKYNRRPSTGSKNQEEKSLGVALDKLNRSNPEWRKDFDNRFPSSLKFSEERIKQIETFAKKHGRRPFPYSKNQEEKSLGQALYGLNKSKPEWRKDFDNRFPLSNKSSEERIKQIEAFAKKHGRRPSQNSKIQEEKSLGAALTKLNTSKPEWRKDFDNRFPLLVQAKRSPEEWIQQIKAFAKKHGRRPSASSKNQEEKSLGRALNNLNKSHPEWRKDFDNIFPLLRQAKRSVKNLDTGKIYNSISEAARDCNTTASNIQQYVKGKLRTTGGFRWAYTDEQSTEET